MPHDGAGRPYKNPTVVRSSGEKERTSAREGDTRGVTERLHGTPSKIVSTRIL